MPEYIVKYKLEKFGNGGYVTPDVIYDGGYVWSNDGGPADMVLVGKANYKVTEGTPDGIIDRITQQEWDDHKSGNLKPGIIEKINERTEELINYGIVYKDVRFWTDQTAQQNYTGLWLKRDSALVTYPYTVWDGEGSVAISGADEMDVFCSTVLTHVQTQRVTGKALRDSLSGLTPDELASWVDPRGPLSGI